MVSCKSAKVDIVIDVLPDTAGQYNTSCYLKKNQQKALLYHTYNPVEVDTIFHKCLGDIYVLKEDITTEEALYEYIIYDVRQNLLFESNHFAVFDSISNDELEMIVKNHQSVEFKTHKINFDSDELYIKYRTQGKLRYKILKLSAIGEPPYIRK